MRQARMGSTDLCVSRLCLGMMSFGDPSWQPWVLGEAEAHRLYRAALDLGITFFDTADAYSAGLSEEILGRCARAAGCRDAVTLATKVGLPVGATPGGLRPERIAAALNASLQRLGLDCVDLYQLHGWDPDVPVEETMGALEEAVRAGKARHVGASNFAAWQMAVANDGRSIPLATMQLQLNLLYREEEREMLPYCRHAARGVIAYSPLARGRLTSSAATPTEARRAGTDAKGQRLYGDAAAGPVADAVRAVAAGRGVAPAHVALAWVLGTPGVTTALVGATEEAHLRDAVAALDLDLEQKERRMLEAPYQARPHERGDLSGGVG